MTIRQRILVMVGIPILSILILGGFGWYYMNKTANTVDTIVNKDMTTLLHKQVTPLIDKEMPHLQKLHKCIERMLNADRDAYQVVVAEKQALAATESDMPKILTDHKENLDQVKERMALASADFSTDKEKALYAAFEKEYGLWRKATEKVVAQAGTPGKLVFARKSSNSGTAHSTFKEMRKHIDELQGEVEKDIKLVEQGVKNKGIAVGTEGQKVTKAGGGIVGNLSFAKWVFIIVAMLVLLVGVLTNSTNARRIVLPIEKASSLAETIGHGDLSKRLQLGTNDEVGKMAEALDRMADGLERQARLAEAIADGDLTQDVVVASDVDVLGNALKRMSEGLNQLVGNVNRVSVQINAGASQVSDASQALSQGATEQAASLEEIASSMTQMGGQTKTNAENAGQANMLATTARDSAEKGDAQMRDMVSAMQDISVSSQEISKIIKVIDDIAFQTNLLALNAAVEAARAGRHGKGFAVVADEVRNLAGRSARAAQETAELIEGSLKKVENGRQVADATAASLEEIVQHITKVTDLIGEIASASNEQAQGISQVVIGLDQIDSVTQQNTANAEETSAAAEELASQAGDLRQVLTKFRIKQGGTGQHSMRPASTGGPTGAGPGSIRQISSDGWGSSASLPDTSATSRNVMIQWDDSLKVGISRVDVQHKRLVDLINQLYAAMREGRGNDEVERTLMELVQYTKNHFGMEEELFKKYGYPEKDQHMKIHAELVGQVNDFAEKFKTGKASVSVKLMEFLKGWLINHIKGTDMKYKDFLISKGVE